MGSAKTPEQIRPMDQAKILPLSWKQELGLQWGNRRKGRKNASSPVILRSLASHRTTHQDQRGRQSVRSAMGNLLRGTPGSQDGPQSARETKIAAPLGAASKDLPLLPTENIDYYLMTQP